MERLPHDLPFDAREKGGKGHNWVTCNVVQIVDDPGHVSLAACREHACPEVASCLFAETPIDHFVGDDFSEETSMEIWVL